LLTSLDSSQGGGSKKSLDVTLEAASMLEDSEGSASAQQII
jgi:hypothetical protein